MMRLGLLVLVMACGGKAAAPTTTPTQTTTPSNTTAPAPSEQPPPAAPNTDDKSVCANRPDMFGPFTLTEAQMTQRYGHGAKKLTDAPATKDKAIELCGIAASRSWLSSVTCAGGEKPKQLGRTGSVGPGGRCGAIIDLYEVQCPEQVYEVFLDIYMCGPNESFM